MKTERRRIDAAFLSREVAFPNEASSSSASRAAGSADSRRRSRDRELPLVQSIALASSEFRSWHRCPQSVQPTRRSPLPPAPTGDLGLDGRLELEAAELLNP